MTKLKAPSPPCPTVSSVSFSIAGLEVVFKEAVLGGFELEVLLAGPEIIDAGAEGTGGTGLGGGNPKPRSASESL